MNALILAVLICICAALYAIWRTQMEILKVLRRINLKALNAALFLRPDLEAVWNLGPEDVLTHTHVGNPLACAAALIVLDALPKLLDEVLVAGERFEQAGWHGAGLLRARAGDWKEAWRRGVIVMPAGPGGSLISATPPLTIALDDVDEALHRLEAAD